MKKNPEFIIFCGPMFSCKTTFLLSQLDKFKYQNRKIFAFKPQVDDRYSTTEIVTHVGWRRDCTLIGTGTELIQRLAEQTGEHEDSDNIVVAVDELFMVPGIADSLIWLFNSGITIVVSTLDMSFNCHPFDEVVKVLPWATKVKKCVAVCSVCQRDANYTWRKPGAHSGDIVVGGGEMYEARCYEHHPMLGAK